MNQNKILTVWVSKPLAEKAEKLKQLAYDGKPFSEMLRDAIERGLDETTNKCNAGKCGKH